jgi:Mrp family chromosome partitioning ATPase
MTEHRKIDTQAARPASLLERADASFGLERLSPAQVPKNLPPPRKPKPVSVERSAAPLPPLGDEQPHSQQSVEPSIAVQPPLQFNGPYQKIDRNHLREGGLIVPEAPVTGLLEEFRIVKRELLADARASNDPAAQRILVCSPHPGEGKTYCATNLAIALAAEREVEVVLVDADVINPSVAKRLGIKAGAGLMDALADPSLAVENLVIETDIPGLFVLPAGTGSALDAEYLASQHTGNLLDCLTRGAPNRVLVFDTPPALAASPAAELASHVGQALLVVRADDTSRAALEDAQQLLSSCPDIKLLINAVRYSPSGRSFGNYGVKEK